MALCQGSKKSVWMVDFLKNLGVSLRGQMVVNLELIIREALLSLEIRFSKTVQSVSIYNIISRAISSRSRGST